MDGVRFAAMGDHAGAADIRSEDEMSEAAMRHLPELAIVPLTAGVVIVLGLLAACTIGWAP